MTALAVTADAGALACAADAVAVVCGVAFAAGAGTVSAAVAFASVEARSGAVASLVLADLSVVAPLVDWPVSPNAAWGSFPDWLLVALCCDASCAAYAVVADDVPAADDGVDADAVVPFVAVAVDCVAVSGAVPELDAGVVVLTTPEDGAASTAAGGV